MFKASRMLQHLLANTNTTSQEHLLSRANTLSQMLVHQHIHILRQDLLLLDNLP
jgi:hypothetical protein